ncbi:LysM peptidoglycan-binding domain-containing protein [Paeniglutamicibacter antarcticus]|uniref:LysM peptidoglycan-binding domain-containing protein n=1 Tax=Arthrobacter terrae TaxID=2935737 RepID=A0A931CMR2_9MICC|nr:LysM peptidoglycan-binding domain-containing protein [Arthrobacter terrae]MBG0739320.1 LysM peptidoglycan-binding domain-containing protein [Arthrobacter terrae]
MNATPVFDFAAARIERTGAAAHIVRSAQVSRTPQSDHTAGAVHNAGAVRPAGRAPLRLTRRGRFVLVGVPLMLAAIVVLVLAGFFTAPAQASVGSGSVGVHAATVTVLAGQTLWSIASTADSNRDPRDVVADLVELNNLSNSVLQPGQQLFVPLPG